MLISSTSNQQIKDLVKLSAKKERDKLKKFLVEGEHLIEEAINNNCLISLIELEGYETSLKYPKIIVTANVMKKLSKQASIPKIIGVCKKQESQEIKGNVLILDDIQDPGNLGTIIRSAAAFNIETIILSPNSVDIYNDKVIRSSEGLIFSLNFIVNDLEKTIIDLKKDNYQIIASVVNGTNNISKMASKYALIVGNEGNGINECLVNLADELVTIKMNAKVESLNVGVATGILLYELNKE